ncbi:hypothetical protein SAMN05880590_11189 [Rhizobium sp. RU35A]|uniref:hypothetical protein n=1 Tax=Rhizobium sp. RU35A TaxID=1907414 RepID=UPI000954491F|nr:hypothetical protein [Rhizobium sp. RU35A]SIR06535.1 hypothetical protein SAMN05880590_11189 [Rhizobium sp. RU35A]
MELRLPFRVEYKTENPVPIPEIVGSLLSLQMLLEEAASNLETFVPGLTIEKIDIRVQEISHGSLKEILFVSLFGVFQDELDHDLPDLVQEFMGVEMPENTHTLLTILVIVAIVYGADYIKSIVTDGVKETLTASWKKNLIQDLADKTGRSYDETKKALDDRYGKPGRIKRLADASVKFFQPSKRQGNAPIDVGSKRIDPRFVEDTEADFVYEEAASAEKSQDLYGVRLRIHQKDLDRETSGWAAMPLGIHNKRLPMKLLDGVTADQVWGNDEITADIVLLSKRKGVDFVPSEIHVLRVSD